MEGLDFPMKGVVLLVEDREDDIRLIKKAVEKGGINQPMTVVRDGQEAIFYLAGVGCYSNRAEHPLPDLVLLDVNAPRADGFEVLNWIRRQPEFDSLRVVVLSPPGIIPDLKRAYSLGADSIMVKPAWLGQNHG